MIAEVKVSNNTDCLKNEVIHLFGDTVQLLKVAVVFIFQWIR